MLEEEVEVVCPYAVRRPANPYAGKGEYGVNAEAADGNEWVVRCIKLDQNEHDHEYDPDAEESTAVGIRPSHQWSLIQGKIDEHKARYACEGTPPIKYLALRSLLFPQWWMNEVVREYYHGETHNKKAHDGEDPEAPRPPSQVSEECAENSPSGCA